MGNESNEINDIFYLPTKEFLKGRYDMFQHFLSSTYKKNSSPCKLQWDSHIMIYGK